MAGEKPEESFLHSVSGELSELMEAQEVLRIKQLKYLHALIGHYLKAPFIPDVAERKVTPDDKTLNQLGHWQSMCNTAAEVFGKP